LTVVVSTFAPVAGVPLQSLVVEARRLYVDEPLGLEELDQREQTVYALDATTIDLCLSVFPWARFRRTKAGLKMHTFLDVRGNIPAFTWVTEARFSDVRILDVLTPEPGSIYLLDRGFLDFSRLYRLNAAHATFVTRAKRGLQWERLYSRNVDRSTGLVCDQTIRLSGTTSAHDYPTHLRRVAYRDPETGKKLDFLTNDFTLLPLTVAELYRLRWQVELFFKWIKQHLQDQGVLRHVLRRANFTAEEKVRIVRMHLLEKVPVSDLCDQHDLLPSQFYTWQRQLFEQGSKAFESLRNSRERELERKIEKLQATTREKDEVIAEVARELVFLRKSDGGV
jgi:transposase-like protein